MRKVTCPMCDEIIRVTPEEVYVLNWRVIAIWTMLGLLVGLMLGTLLAFGIQLR